MRWWKIFGMSSFHIHRVNLYDIIKFYMFYLCIVFIIILPLPNSSTTIQTPSTIALDFPKATQSMLPEKSNQKNIFNTDCSDPHFKEIRCSTQSVDCSQKDKLKSINQPAGIPANNSRQWPNAAHDIRIETYDKANGFTDHQPDSYRLSVDMSWQTPPNNSTRLLSAFWLEIRNRKQENKQIPKSCFLFDVSASNWTEAAIYASPRLHFHSESVFEFAQEYEITLQSAPWPANASNSALRYVQKEFTTPNNPVLNQSNIFNNLNDLITNNTNLTPNCFQYSHPFASKWTAGFRRIYLHALARTMQIEFVGAPPQYCFEQYEVRLLDESGMELLHSGIVSYAQMKREQISNSNVYFGEYNFTNLEIGRSYIPSVIPVERAADGRCLCPVQSTNPYDNKVVCSCIAADWKPVRLNRLDIVDCVNCTNEIPTLPPPEVEKPTTTTQISYILVVLQVAFLIASIIFFAYFYRWAKKPSDSTRIRFMAPDSTVQTLMENGNVYHGLGTLEAVRNENPLILDIKNDTTILIVYAHDSKAHSNAVLALGEFLRDIFNMNIQLDHWDREKIELNLINYISRSVVMADRVIIVNSIGAIHRYYSKLNDMENFIVENNAAGPLDSLFLAQIDMALQHPNIISVRFENTTTGEILPMLNNRLQYLLPDNLIQMVSEIVGRNLKHDARFQGYNPQIVKLNAAVAEMIAVNRKDPDWFLHTHHRRIRSFKPQTSIQTEPVEPLQIKHISEKELSVNLKPVQEELAEKDTMDVTSSTQLLSEDEMEEKTNKKLEKVLKGEREMKNHNDFHQNELMGNNFIRPKLSNDILKNNELSSEQNNRINLFRNQENIQNTNKLLPLVKNPLIDSNIVDITNLYDSNKVAATVLNFNKLLPIQQTSSNDTNLPNGTILINGFNDNEIQTDSGIFETTNFTQDDIEPMSTQQVPNGVPNGINQQQLNNTKHSNKQPYKNNHQIISREDFKATTKGLNNSKDNNTDSGLISEVDLQPQHIVSAS